MTAERWAKAFALETRRRYIEKMKGKTSDRVVLGVYLESYRIGLIRFGRLIQGAPSGVARP